MFGKIAARSAGLLVLLPLVFGGPVSAFAQYQVSAIDPAEPVI